MRLTRSAARVLALCLLVPVAGCEDSRARDAWLWARQQALPGPLTTAHARLAEDCASCHTPIRGVQAQACIACHALNGALVARQTTAFHATVSDCADCHVEHGGPSALRAPMDHDLFAEIAARGAATFGSRAPDGRLLDCSKCHQLQDQHAGLLGSDCAGCHETTVWRVAGYSHPTPRSRDCAQCHEAPPSHYMEHFRMLSARVARQEHASVDECYRCHLTTAWNDIRGVGFYKHH